MLKRIWLYVLLGTGLYAQLPTNQTTTGDTRNGRFWLSLSVDEKRGYLIGFAEAYGSATLATLIVTMVDTARFGAMLKKCSEEDPFPYNVPVGEVREALDRFFKDPTVRHLTIPIGLRIIRMQFEGKSNDEIAKTLEWYRTMLAPSRESDDPNHLTETYRRIFGAAQENNGSKDSIVGPTPARR